SRRDFPRDRGTGLHRPEAQTVEQQRLTWIGRSRRESVYLAVIDRSAIHMIRANELFSVDLEARGRKNRGPVSLNGDVDERTRIAIVSEDHRRRSCGDAGRDLDIHLRRTYEAHISRRSVDGDADFINRG